MTSLYTALSPARLAELSTIYRDGLLNDVVPFWLRHGLDREHGGIMTALNRDGSVIDTDKGLWQQGRFVWLLATLCHTVEPRQEWKSAAESTINFIRRAAHSDGDHMYFQVTREGAPLRRRRYVYTESFAAIAMAAWSRISGDEEAKQEAIALFHRFVDYNRTPGWITPKVDLATRPSQSLGPNLILINTCRVLRDTVGFSEAETFIDEAIDIVERYFVNEDYQVVLETVGPEGEIIDHFDGRLLNPGHAIELAWFILHEAWQRDNDARLLALGCKILDWTWARGWDQEYGGILYFRDLKGFPVQEYWQDMKFWWPQNETIIATLLAYTLTGDAKYAEWHTQIHDWTYKHFPDADYGEWYGYLHRDGRLSVPLKGNIWKGPFHIPRMQWYCWQLCDKLAEQRNGATASPISF